MVGNPQKALRTVPVYILRAMHLASHMLLSGQPHALPIELSLSNISLPPPYLDR